MLLNDVREGNRQILPKGSDRTGYDIIFIAVTIFAELVPIKANEVDILLVFYFGVEFELGSVNNGSDDFGNVAAGKFVGSVNVAGTKTGVFGLGIKSELLLVFHFL